jgi:hypothetical protein
MLNESGRFLRALLCFGPYEQREIEPIRPLLRYRTEAISAPAKGRYGQGKLDQNMQQLKNEIHKHALTLSLDQVAFILRGSRMHGLQR